MLSAQHVVILYWYYFLVLFCRSISTAVLHVPLFRGIPIVSPVSVVSSVFRCSTSVLWVFIVPCSGVPGFIVCHNCILQQSLKEPTMALQSPLC